MLQIKRSKEEEKLAAACRKGDRKAQRSLYEKYAPLFMAVCKRYVKDDAGAEDVLVSGFTKIFTKIDQFKGEGSFEGWMRRIMVNESLSYIRKHKSLFMQVELDTVERSPNFESLANDLEVEDLMKMIQRLPVGYRTVFNMYAIEGFSHREIAEKLEISENTSKSQLSRARKHLQQLLLEAEEMMDKALKRNEG